MAILQLSEKNEKGTDAKSVMTLIDSIPALVAYVDCNMILQYCNQPSATGFR